MVFRLRMILLVVVVLLLLWIIQQIKSRKLELRYTLSWLMLIVVMLLMVLFPNLLYWASDTMGIQSPVNALFLCGFAFSLSIIYTLTVAVSKQSEEIKKLTQKIALLEKDSKEQKDTDSEEKREDDR